MPGLSKEDLARQVAHLARVSPEDVRDGADLTALICSLDVMRLVNAWRVRGLPVSYRDLAESPTLDAWWARLTHLLRAHPHLAA